MASSRGQITGTGGETRGELRMSPAERSLRARMAAYTLHSRYDSAELLRPARKAFDDRFLREVDPEGKLSPQERRRGAECARKAYFSALAAKSAKVRRERKARAERAKGRHDAA